MKKKNLLFLVFPVLISLLFLSACSKVKTPEAATDSTTSQSVLSSATTGEQQTDSAEKIQKETTEKPETKDETSAENSGTEKIEDDSVSKPFEPTDYKAAKAETANAAIGSKLRLLDLGSSGGVMCAKVKNISDSDIEYCLLKAVSGKKTAEFVLSVLPKGETAVVSEKNEKKYSKAFSNAVWSAENEVLFGEPLSTMEDVFETQCTDGALIIKNITNADIDRVIYVCYKTVISGELSGSVSYRMKLGKISSGETKQLFSKNIGKNSRVMYIEYGS